MKWGVKNTVKKRIFSFLLAFALLGNLTCAFAAGPEELQPYASDYLDGYGIGATAKGGGKMSVTFLVYGTDTMDKIGAQKIVIEEWDGESWEDFAEYTADKNPNFLVTKAAEHTASVTFYGTPGLQYRATLYAYAELDAVFDIGSITSNPETCR